MDVSYTPLEIEQDAQAYWERNQSFKVVEDLNKEKFYCLSMFPYPSGNLHMGHVRNYTIGDVISRYQMLQGKNVLQPIGWDAFGLPAENAAIKHNVHPAEWTYKNIDSMRAQFKRLGYAYDWKREFATCQPEYYRWEQWFFIKLYEKGLVYKKKAMVNWDPVDQTVLANEQVIDGCGWRSGAPIERREIPQWFIKITTYADELLEDLDKLTEWPEQVRTMQRNWIGRSEGVSIYFDVPDHNERIKVFTTRADTLMGATYLAVASEHPLAQRAGTENPAIQGFIAECKKTLVAEAEMATMEKRGMPTGYHAIHPITGEPVPIWIANFVLMEYGAGAVMSVPGHDQRDWEFAQKYSLPIKQVIQPIDDTACDLDKAAFLAYGQLLNSGQFDGLSSEQAITAVITWLKDHQKGKPKVHYRLRDWGVSRQRYWGTPIPMILCETCGAVPVPENQLPVVLPEDVEFTGASNPLHTHPDFNDVPCPKCGMEAKRETDTFDTFMESSWYYARFASFNQDNAMLDDRAKYWTPVDTYVGGIEHAVMHLLYARFFHKLMRDEGLLNSDEPFIHMLTQGMVLKDGAKMSKSKGNVVDPDTLIDKYGSDTVRLFMIFASSPEQSLEWSDAGVDGCFRYLKRLWHFAQNNKEALTHFNQDHLDNNHRVNRDNATETQHDWRRQLHEILQQAKYDYQRLQFNTVVSACMKIFNLLTDLPDENDDYTTALKHEGMSICLRLLYPITPHICHHLWRECDFGDDILNAKWVKVDKSAIKTDVVEYVVQVNGKLRAHIKVAANADEETVQEAALNDEAIKRFMADKSLRKVIVITQRKLINLVVSD